MDSHGIFSENLTPLSLLLELADTEANGYLKVLSGEVEWYIFFERGKITYASHSIEPLERLDRNLRRLGCKMTETLKEAYGQVSLRLKNVWENINKSLDYPTVCYLVSQQQLEAFKATELVDELVKEVIESYSWIQEGSYDFFNQRTELPKMARLEVQPVINYCQNRLQSWQSLGKEVWSPYQRPYFFGKNNSNDQQVLPELQNKLSSFMEQRLATLLKGFSFRQLSILLNQDELKLAQSLQPYIAQGTILLREPQPPFDKLPKIPQQMNVGVSQITKLKPDIAPNVSISVTGVPTQTSPPKPVNTIAKYTVVCVDDSPTILNEIGRFLDDKVFTVHKISDPVKALMQILRIKPDIILLDVGMPNIDGYELCRLIRNNSMFKTVPIVMVTGNTGIIDRGKARLVGASAYLTKPFTQSELLKMVFKHLN
jgi:two-component system, chemotaxis family, response regulator PixG